MKKYIIGLITILLIFPNVISGANAAPETNHPPEAPTGMLVELLSEPLGIENVSPGFSWIVNDPDRDEIQSAYQLLVASSLEGLAKNDADVWDSGKTNSSQSSNVVFGGDALLASSNYYWKVRTWDKDGQAGPYSEPQLFTTAVKDDWTAKPIWMGESNTFQEEGWSDYTFEVDFTIQAVSAGVYFRAHDFNKNYLWQIIGGNPGKLKKHVTTTGTYKVIEEIPIMPLELNKEYKLKIELNGSQIKTYINDQLIDTTTDETISSGLIGFRNGGTEQAWYDNVRVYNSEKVLYEDDFSGERQFNDGTITDGKLFMDKGKRAIYTGLAPLGNDFVFMRKSFELQDKEIERAIAHVTAQSPENAKQYVYRLYMNGQFVGTGPERGFDDINRYNTYDVTSLLKQGKENVIGSLNYTASDKRFLFQMDVYYKDGTKERIQSDSSWKSMSGSRAYGDGGNSGTSYFYAPRENINANYYPYGWNDVGFNDDSWTNSLEKPAITRLQASAARNTEMHIVEPVKIVDKGNGNYFIDFGKAVTAGIRLNVEASAGQQVELRMGEELSGPNTVRYNMRTGNNYQEVWTLKKGQQTLENWGYKVFRYAEILNSPVELTKDNIQAVVLRHPFDDEASDFKSSDSVLNDVWDFAKYSIKATALDVYVDTHTRERTNYEGDAYINQLSHYAVDREYAFPRYSMEYLFYRPTWPTEYKQQTVMMAWEDYMNTGNKDALEQYYTILTNKTLKNNLNSDFLVEKSTTDDLVDWPESQRDGYQFTTINTVINTFNYAAINHLADIAAVLGKTEDASSYSLMAENIRKAMNTHLYNKDLGRFKDGKNSTHYALHASAFPLAVGAVDPENEAAVADYVVSRGMAVSVYGSQFLLTGLYNANQGEAALKLMNAKTGNSWGHMMYDLGATIVGEAWDPAQKSNMSFSHAWASAPANVIPRGLFGIQPIEAGYSKFQIKPQPGSLEWASIKVPSIKGSIAAQIENGSEKFQLDVIIPANTSADVHIPLHGMDHPYVIVDGQWVEGRIQNGFVVIEGVGSGEHQFVRETGYHAELHIENNGEMFINDSANIQLEVTNADGQVIAPTQVQYSSSNTEVAVVSESGRVTAVGQGEAEITVQMTIHDDRLGTFVMSSSLKLKVVQPEISEIKLNIANSRLAVGDKTSVWLSGSLENHQPIDFKDYEIGYSSEDESVAIVDQQGQVQAIGKGITNVIADFRKVLFEDEFSDGTMNFTGGSIVDGKLVMGNGNTGLLKYGAEWSDYTVETSFTIKQAAAGIFLRAQNAQNNYFWQIGNLHGEPPVQGEPILKTHIFTNGTPKILKEIPLGHVINEDEFFNTEHTLRVELNGNEIKTFINGHLVDTTIDNTYSSGAIGFRQGRTESALYDNVKIMGPAMQRSAALEVVDISSEASATLSGTDSAAAGQSFDILYGLSQVDEEVFAQDITIRYDADKLELASAPESTDESIFVIADYKQSPGEIRIIGVHLGAGQLDPNQDWIKLSFRAKSDAAAGIANIKATNLAVADSYGAERTLNDVTHAVQINVIDKTSLLALIDEATAVHNAAVEGKLVGQYPAGSKAVLWAAIESAKEVADNPSATQTQIEQAALALNEALQLFKSLVVVTIPGDYNNDERVSIGDLAIMARAYGRTEADADWDQVKHYDLNGDGRIDIVDLSKLAQLIFEW